MAILKATYEKNNKKNTEYIIREYKDIGITTWLYGDFTSFDIYARDNNFIGTDIQGFLERQGVEGDEMDTTIESIKAFEKDYRSAHNVTMNVNDGVLKIEKVLPPKVDLKYTIAQNNWSRKELSWIKLNGERLSLPRM